MVHFFETEIAKKYGMNEAVILNYIFYCVKNNEANERNYRDGLYWTHNSMKALVELFPYLTERQIRYALDKLIKSGLITTGNYNQNPCDRTLWYAVTDFGKCILQNCQMEVTKLSNVYTINNPINNQKENIIIYNNIKEKSDLEHKEPNKKESKITFGEYGRVKLTPSEYEKLVKDFGKDFIDRQIAYVDEYVESNNNKNKYTNFNLVIRKSIREGWQNKNSTNSRNPNTANYNTVYKNTEGLI